jgi:hypothetical protein
MQLDPWEASAALSNHLQLLLDLPFSFELSLSRLFFSEFSLAFFLLLDPALTIVLMEGDSQS